MKTPMTITTKKDNEKFMKDSVNALPTEKHDMHTLTLISNPNFSVSDECKITALPKGKTADEFINELMEKMDENSAQWRETVNALTREINSCINVELTRKTGKIQWKAGTDLVSYDALKSLCKMLSFSAVRRIHSISGSEYVAQLLNAIQYDTDNSDVYMDTMKIIMELFLESTMKCNPLMFWNDAKGNKPVLMQYEKRRKNIVGIDSEITESDYTMETVKKLSYVFRKINARISSYRSAKASESQHDYIELMDFAGQAYYIRMPYMQDVAHNETDYRKMLSCLEIIDAISGSENQNDILKMLYIKGMSTHTVAERKGCTHNAVINARNKAFKNADEKLRTKYEWLVEDAEIAKMENNPYRSDTDAWNIAEIAMREMHEIENPVSRIAYLFTKECMEIDRMHHNDFEKTGCYMEYEYLPERCRKAVKKH